MSWVSDKDDGCTIALKVKAGAKHESIVPEHDVLRVAVRAPAIDGRANEAVIALLAETFGCRRSDIALLRGEHDPRKVVRVRGVSMARAMAALRSN